MSVDIVILIAVLALVFGVIIGALISRNLLPPKQQQSLQQELEQTRDELHSYQRDVAQHFMQSSNMLKSLSSQYKSMHEHLAKGAIALTNSEVSQSVIAAASGDSDILEDAGALLDDIPLNQPKDWAPKRPGESGTLSEEYGIARPEKPTKPGIEVSSAVADIPKHPS